MDNTQIHPCFWFSVLDREKVDPTIWNKENYFGFAYMARSNLIESVETSVLPEHKIMMEYGLFFTVGYFNEKKRTSLI
jgi:hypothetical protein